MYAGLPMTNRIQNKNTKKICDWSSRCIPTTINVSLLAVIVFVGFFYLTQVNAIAVKGYIIQDMEQQLEDNQLALRQLELTRRGHQSASTVMAKVDQLGMVPADQVEYVTVPSDQVAIAR